MVSPYLPNLTSSLLNEYCEAALRNAEELLVEAALLRDHDHMARAYFLAVSCIEEAGKALQAFDGQRRNLSDPGVCTKLVAGLQSHPQKINYVLFMWALDSADQREGLKVATDLIWQLKRGREPSMYSDLRTEPDRVQTPREVVRAVAARDCVKLAAECLAYARRHVSEKVPTEFTRVQDKLFTMKSAKFKSLLEQEDFWWFFISRLEEGQQDLAEAVSAYEHQYVAKGRVFGSPKR